MPTARLHRLLLAVPLLLAACSGGGAVASGPSSTAPPAMTDALAMTDEPAMTDASEVPAVTDGPMGSPAPAVSGDGPTGGNPAAEALAGKAWATQSLTDVSTGETFTIASLAGRPVFVETMAIWCTNCRAQQARFTEALAGLPAGSAEYVVLTVDPSETAEDLARYREQRGFAGRYAVAGRALSRALEAEFGANALNPPSVPVVFISRAGAVEFTTGAESVEDIRARIGG